MKKDEFAEQDIEACLEEFDKKPFEAFLNLFWVHFSQLLLT